MEPQLRVQVVDDEIVVSVPGFRYSATYYKPYDARQLVARIVPITDDLRTKMRRQNSWLRPRSSPTRRPATLDGLFEGQAADSARFGGRAYANPGPAR